MKFSYFYRIRTIKYKERSCNAHIYVQLYMQYDDRTTPFLLDSFCMLNSYMEYLAMNLDC
jgi:hypothetical protein